MCPNGAIEKELRLNDLEDRLLIALSEVKAVQSDHCIRLSHTGYSLSVLAVACLV